MTETGLTQSLTWVPVWIKHDQSVGSDEIETTAASLGGQHEDKLTAGRVIELVHHLGPLLDGHGPVQSHVTVMPELTELLKHVEGLSVVGHKDDLVGCGALDHGEQTVKYGEFARQLWLQPASARIVAGREELSCSLESFFTLLTGGEYHVGVIDQLLQ